MQQFENKRPTLKWIAGIAVIAVIAVLVVMYFDSFLAFLGDLWDAVTPLLIGCVFAYLINLIMVRYERVWFPNSTKPIVQKTRRGICLALAILTVTAVIVIVVVLIVMEFRSAASAIIDGLTDTVNMIADALMSIPAFADYVESGTSNWEDIYSTVIDYLGGASGAIESIVDLGVTAVGDIVNIVFGMIFTLYLLIDKERVIRGAKRLVNLIPNAGVRDYLFHVGQVANGCFSRFIFGQCIEACILGVLCAVFGMLFRFPYAGIIGVIVGVTSLVPFLGAWIGGIVGTVMILSVSPIQAVQFVIFIVVLQQVEGHLIYPNVVGQAVQLPSIWVFVAVIAGGSLFGLLGVLLGVPLISTIRTLWMEYLEKRDAKEAARLEAGEGGGEGDVGGETDALEEPASTAAPAEAAAPAATAPASAPEPVAEEAAE